MPTLWHSSRRLTAIIVPPFGFIVQHRSCVHSQREHILCKSRSHWFSEPAKFRHASQKFSILAESSIVKRLNVSCAKRAIMCAHQLI